MAKNRGKSVEPHIYRRLSGGYFVRLRTKSGEIERVAQTLSDARLILRQVTLGRNGVTVGGERKSLKDILDAYVGRLEAAGKPTDVVRWMNRKLLDFFGEGHPAPLTDDDMERWAMSAKADYVRRGIVTLRTAHRRAGMPIPATPEYEYEPGSRIIVPEDQAAAFFAELPWGSPERATAELMLLTGVRLAHILALRVADVNGPFMVVRSRKGRGLNRITIEEHPITDKIRKVLDSVIPPNASPHRQVILLNGRTPTHGSFRKRLAAASRRAKITPTIQSLAWVRNFTITRLIEKGVTIDVVSRMAGHASVATTKKHYDKAKLTQDRMAASLAMESVVGTSPPGPPITPTPRPDLDSFGPVSKEDTPPVVEDNPEHLN